MVFIVWDIRQNGNAFAQNEEILALSASAVHQFHSWADCMCCWFWCQ